MGTAALARIRDAALGSVFETAARVFAGAVSRDTLCAPLVSFTARDALDCSVFAGAIGRDSISAAPSGAAASRARLDGGGEGTAAAAGAGAAVAGLDCAIADVFSPLSRGDGAGVSGVRAGGTSAFARELGGGAGDCFDCFMCGAFQN